MNVVGNTFTLRGKNMSNQNFIETEDFKVWTENDGIVRDVIKKNSVFDYKKAKALIDAYHEISGGKCLPVYHDMSDILSADKDAREYVTSEPAQKVIKVLAVITKSPVSQMLGNFFLGLNKPPYPTKLFQDEEKALKWLRQYVE